MQLLIVLLILLSKCLAVQIDDPFSCIVGGVCNSELVDCSLRTYSETCLSSNIPPYTEISLISCCFKCCVDFWSKYAHVSDTKFGSISRYIFDEDSPMSFAQRGKEWSHQRDRLEIRFEHIARPQYNYIRSIKDYHEKLASSLHDLSIFYDPQSVDENVGDSIATFESDPRVKQIYLPLRLLPRMTLVQVCSLFSGDTNPFRGALDELELIGEWPCTSKNSKHLQHSIKQIAEKVKIRLMPDARGMHQNWLSLNHTYHAQASFFRLHNNTHHDSEEKTGIYTTVLARPKFISCFIFSELPCGTDSRYSSSIQRTIQVLAEIDTAAMCQCLRLLDRALLPANLLQPFLDEILISTFSVVLFNADASLSQGVMASSESVSKSLSQGVMASSDNDSSLHWSSTRQATDTVVRSDLYLSELEINLPILAGCTIHTHTEHLLTYPYLQDVRCLLTLNAF